MTDKKQPADTDSPGLAAGLIQEEPRRMKKVGERVWGPYKIHEGSTRSEKYSGGPYGLGDPNDTTLRKVEMEIMIPNLIKKKSKSDYCKNRYDDLFHCAQEKGFFVMPFACRAQAKELRECLSAVQNNERFREQCTQEYLEQRSEYRRTGIRKPLKRM